jgi:hypothetical protein
MKAAGVHFTRASEGYNEQAEGNNITAGTLFSSKKSYGSGRTVAVC